MIDYITLTDIELIDLLRVANHDAYTEIYNRYKGILLVHAYKKLGDFEEAKDIVQEMFSSLWNERSNIPPTKNLAGYLYTAIRNKIFNYVEHKKVESRYASSFNNFIKEANYVTDLVIRERDMAELIDKEIALLPPKMRGVFILSRKHHLSHKEIAEHLNISEFTVKNHIKVALKILRPKLGLMALIVLHINL